MLGILKGYEINVYKFENQKEMPILTLYFEGFKFESKDTQTKTVGVPLYSLQYKGSLEDVLPFLNIGAPYQVMTYQDSGNKRRYINGLIQQSESIEVKK